MRTVVAHLCVYICVCQYVGVCLCVCEISVYKVLVQTYFSIQKVITENKLYRTPELEMPVSNIQFLCMFCSSNDQKFQNTYNI